MRTVRPVIYRMRWLWLGLWLFGCLLGLAYLVEPLDWWQAWWQPNGLIDVVRAYWSGDLTQRWHLGLDGIFGLEDFWTHGADGWAALATIAFFILPFPLFLDLGKRSIETLPARRKLAGAPIIAASFMLSLLIAACLAFGVDWFDSWGIDDEIERLTNGQVAEDSVWPMMSLATILLAWGLSWIALHLLYRRRERYWQLEEITLWLMLAAAAIWLVAAPSRDNKWGDYGFHTATVLSAFVLLWALGARTALLFMLQRYIDARDHGDDTTCFACEYDLRGSIAGGSKACPECGAPIPHGLLTRPASAS